MPSSLETDINVSKVLADSICWQQTAVKHWYVSNQTKQYHNAIHWLSFNVHTNKLLQLRFCVLELNVWLKVTETDHLRWFVGLLYGLESHLPLDRNLLVEGWHMDCRCWLNKLPAGALFTSKSLTELCSIIFNFASIAWIVVCRLQGKFKQCRWLNYMNSSDQINFTAFSAHIFEFIEVSHLWVTGLDSGLMMH